MMSEAVIPRRSESRQSRLLVVLSNLTFVGFGTRFGFIVATCSAIGYARQALNRIFFHFFVVPVLVCATLHYMALRDAISVRFDDVTKARLDALALHTGLSAADLVRRATEEFLARVESDGKITIPVKMVADGRAIYRARRKKNS